MVHTKAEQCSSVYTINCDYAIVLLHIKIIFNNKKYLISLLLLLAMFHSKSGSINTCNILLVVVAVGDYSSYNSL